MPIPHQQLASRIHLMIPSSTKNPNHTCFQLRIMVLLLRGVVLRGKGFNRDSQSGEILRDFTGIIGMKGLFQVSTSDHVSRI